MMHQTRTHSQRIYHHSYQHCNTELAVLPATNLQRLKDLTLWTSQVLTQCKSLIVTAYAYLMFKLSACMLRNASAQSLRMILFAKSQQLDAMPIPGMALRQTVAYWVYMQDR